MSEEKKLPKFSLGKIFYHNTFVLVFSFAVALISWFLMAAATYSGRSVMVYDVPIEVKLSAEAETDGLRVFNMSYNSADVEVSGSSLLTSKLTAEDFEVSVSLNPTSTKLTGNTLQKMTVPVKAVKRSSVSEYSVSSVNPEEINIEYDRYKEVTYTIENELKYSADSGFYSGAPTLSEDSVIISGPESSVNKISRVAITYSIESPLRSDETFNCPVRLYDQNNQEITDTSGMYLSLSVDTVEVAIPVLVRKTVDIIPTTVHQPSGFSSSRIVVEPAQIEIAGTAEAVSGIKEIQLDTAIDFADLFIDQKNVFEMDISLPTGVRNISSSGDNTVTQASVTINLSGYQQGTVTVPDDNIQIINQPAGKAVTVSTKDLEVSIIGSEAQVAKIIGDAVTVQADLTNFSESSGTVEVPVTVTLSGSGVDSCWATGRYTITVDVSDQNEEATVAARIGGDVAATPQE